MTKEQNKMVNVKLKLLSQGIVKNIFTNNREKFNQKNKSDNKSKIVFYFKLNQKIKMIILFSRN